MTGTGAPTRRVSRYHWPDAWDSTIRYARRLIGSTGSLAVISGIATPIAWWGMRNGLIALVTLLSFLLFLPLSIMGYLTLKRARRRGSFAAKTITLEEASSLFIPVARGVFGTASMAFAVGAVLLALGPLFAQIDPSGSGYRGYAFHLIAPFLPILSPFMLVPACSRFVRRRKGLGLGVAPEGVYYWARYGCFFFSWEWIKGVRALPRGPMFELLVAEPSERPDNPEENWYSRIDQFRLNNTKIQAGMFAVNPALVYYAVCYYFRHPDRRAELGTQAAVDRMRRADYPDIVREIERIGDVRWR